MVLNDAYVASNISATQENLDYGFLGLETFSCDVKSPEVVKHLYLSENRLKNLPSEVRSLTNVTALFISNNQLAELSGRMDNLTKLEALYLSRNALTSFPVELCSLSSIVYLDLSHNQIVDLPPEIGQMENLKYLNLSNNSISILPAEIGQLRNLLSLNLSHNNLNGLPHEIKNLTNLTSLNISYNNFEALVPEIGALNALMVLDASYNRLRDLVGDIAQLRNLMVLDLNENEFDKSIPQEILLKRTRSVVSFFKKLEPINEVKLLVVGQGGVGKTSLVERLLYNTFSEHKDKTKGIEIAKWEIPDKYPDNLIHTGIKRSITINLWDFGGQEILHATHQFFLTKRSLYLLVIDATLTEEENRVKYWLEIVQSFGADSPIILVGNKTDQHQLDINKSKLQNDYPIQDVVAVSAATGDGIQVLKNIITERVNEMPHIRDMLPPNWFKTKLMIAERGDHKKFITYTQYQRICGQNLLTEDSDQRTLIGFLHDMGIIIYFQNHPQLEGLGILDPKWVTNGVYKILNKNELFQNKGVLDYDMLTEILDEKDYPVGKRKFILDMMRKFELCYTIESDKTFLVPDLLPKDEPFTGEWNDSLAFQYYYNVLPSSIITRFIVRMNASIHKTIWRSGVVLKQRENTALVKADAEDRKIFIWVNGVANTRRDFLAAIRSELDAIHKTIIKIEATGKVPHPDYPNLVLDYAELILFERDGITEFPRSVDGRTIMVNVIQMLNGIRFEIKAEPSPMNIHTGRPTTGNENTTASPYPAAQQTALLPDPVKPDEPSESPPWRLVRFIFVSIPRAIGLLFLDPFGKGKDAAPTTPVLLGYIAIIVATAIILGIIGTDALVAWFAGWWRFFNPIK